MTSPVRITEDRMKIGYARISTREQNLDMQVMALEDAGCEKIYEEVADLVAIFTLLSSSHYTGGACGL